MFKPKPVLPVAGAAAVDDSAEREKESEMNLGYPAARVEWFADDTPVCQFRSWVVGSVQVCRFTLVLDLFTARDISFEIQCHH